MGRGWFAASERLEGSGKRRVGTPKEGRGASTDQDPCQCHGREKADWLMNPWPTPASLEAFCFYLGGLQGLLELAKKRE